MKKIYIEGIIASSEDEILYSWLGYQVATPQKLRESLKEASGEEVELWINCYGGDVWSAVNMYDQLTSYEGKTTAIISGLSASASTIVMLGADEVKASLGSQFMIHNATTAASGDYRNLESGAQKAKTSNDSIKAIYVKKTGMSYEDLTALMDAETWYSSRDAKDAGLIDEIIDFSDERLVASSITDEVKERFEKMKAYELKKLNLEKERF